MMFLPKDGRNKEGRSGYSPVCLNEWQNGVCGKPRIKCSECAHRSYTVLDEDVTEKHLKGNLVAGIYPMSIDETCHFLAIDFDDEGWQKDVSVLREICMILIFRLPLSAHVAAMELMFGFSLENQYLSLQLGSLEQHFLPMP